MGVVWRARDERLDRVVAVKQLSRDQPTARALREAQLAARLRHPHAVTVHDIVGQDNTLYLVMEYLPARSLADLLLDRETLPAQQVATIGVQLASGVGRRARRRNRAPGRHAGQRPDHVVGRREDRRFGIARASGAGTITGGGIIAGTPAYLAPEVANGERPAIPRTCSPSAPRCTTRWRAHRRSAPTTTRSPCSCGPLATRSPHLGTPARSPTYSSGCCIASQHHDRPWPRSRTCSMPSWTARPLPPPRPYTPKATTRLIRVRRSHRRLATAGVIGAALLALGVLIGTASFGTTPIANPGATTGPVHAPVAPTTPASGCAAQYEVTKFLAGWLPGSGDRAEHQRNQRRRWQVDWTLPGGHHIEGLWNGSWTVHGSAVTVDSATWNAHLDAASVTTFGLIAATPPTAIPTLPTVTCHTV